MKIENAMLLNDGVTVAAHVDGIERRLAVADMRVARYPVDRCVMLRRTAIMQARKYRDGGNMAKCMEWVGYALYWSGRARKRYETVDETQARVYARVKGWQVRRMEAATARTIERKAEASDVVPFNGDYSLMFMSSKEHGK